MTGTISRITDHGTIVTVEVSTTDAQLQAGVGLPVHFDHRPFSWIIEAETSGDPFELLGREVEVTGPEFNQTLTFIEAD